MAAESAVQEHVAPGGQNGNDLALEEKREALSELIRDYESLGEEEAAEARHQFLLTSEGAPELFAEEPFTRFLEERIQTEDFAGLYWRTPHDVVTFCETFYRSQFGSEEVGERVAVHVNRVLVQALRQFEQRGEMEDVFRLLQLAPASLHMSEADMLRLHHRAMLYERRRVRHRRRWLYGYLILQIVLVGAVFPWLFINAENGRLQQQVEDMTDVEVSESGAQYLSYSDGLYWSLITAASIGYGDVTPKTGAGRVIAAVLGVMGVTTVGVVAGLVIRWITPRRLD